MSPLNSVPFFEKASFGTFEISSLLNVPGHYLRKYGIYKMILNIDHVELKALNNTTELLLLHTRDANVEKNSLFSLIKFPIKFYAFSLHYLKTLLVHNIYCFLSNERS